MEARPRGVPGGSAVGARGDQGDRGRRAALPTAAAGAAGFRDGRQGHVPALLPQVQRQGGGAAHPQ
eukprot:5347254-Prymnesium_polylepis.1